MPPSRALRPLDIVVIEDLDVVRRGLKSLIYTHGDTIATVKAYETVDEIDLSGPAPDVVVLDYWLAGERIPSLDRVPALTAWGAQVLLHTSEEAPRLLQLALQAGVKGVCLKRDGVDDLVDAIRAVGQGTAILSSVGARALVDDDALAARLTPVEIDTLRAIAYGKTTRQIADARQVEVSTVDTHIEHIRRKYADATGNKVNRVTMALAGLKDGYLDRTFLRQDP